MSKLSRYLLHRPRWWKLPMLPRGFSTEFEASDVDPDTAELMRAVAVRCPQSVEILREKRKAESVRDLVRTMNPRKRKRNVRGRAASLIRRALGLTSYDPAFRHSQIHQRKGRR